MYGQILLLSIILIPVLGAFILPLIGKYSALARNITALVMVALSFTAAAFCLPAALRGEPYQFVLRLPMSFDAVFTGDGLAVFMAMVSSLIHQPL